MTDAIQNMIAGMSKETLGAFCRTKSGDFVVSHHSTITAQNEALFPSVFQERFASVDIIGFFKNLEIFIFLVQLKDGVVLSERSCRRLQFDFGKKVLSVAHNTQYSIFTEWLGNDAPANIDKALLVFTDVAGSFRFSLVENLDRNEETPKRFRRQTFFVTNSGSQSNRTFKDRMNLYRAWSSLNELKEVFSVEKLSNEFFTEYKNIYQDFVEYATGKRMIQQGKKWVETIVHPPRTEIMAQFEQIGDAEKAFRDYVKKMMGRLVFLQFLQKKGWLGVPEGQEWGEGDKEYLRKLFQSKSETIKNNFLDTVLERLFFQSLNTDRTASHDIADELLSIQNGQRVRIPYLNGGLFENDVLDQTRVQFPKGYFEELFDTFERFNFTIDENDPNDAEIGVDPEMLGRIFENLLEDNKDKGAFYTPKEIVQYMCREALIAHLGDTPAVRKLVIDFDNADIADPDKESLITKLRTVKICDPAIGSGAFPMGMLHNVLNCRKQLEGIDDTPAEIVRLKSEIIQNNIYGVDIEAGAVDIARLRFWLSIVVDEIQPIPLPNLDYKIMQGNSLLESYNGVELALDLAPAKKQKRGNANHPVVDDQMCFTWDDEAAAIENIKNAIHAFFSPRADVDKNALRARIDATVKEYIKTKCGNVPAINRAVDSMNLNNKPFFLWHLYFADVFASGGFDIVIGNPPYIDSEAMTRIDELNETTYRQQYRNKFKTCKGNWDIFIAFIEQGILLGNQLSTLTYIVPNKLIAAKYASAARINLANNSITKIRDYSETNVFDGIDVYPCTFVLKKENSSGFVELSKMKDKEGIAFTNCIAMRNFNKDPLWDKFFSSPEILSLLTKISAYPRLDLQFPNISGAATVAESYLIRNIIKTKNQISSHFFKLINTGTIDKFKSLWGIQNIRYLGFSDLEPVVAEDQLIAISRNRMIQAAAPKVIVAGMSINIEAFFDSGNYLAGKSTTIICDKEKNAEQKLKALTAILNSSLVSFWIRKNFNSLSMAGGYLNIGVNELSCIPIPTLTQKVIDQLSVLTELAQNGDTSAIHKIDEETYALYSLTLTDVEIIGARFLSSESVALDVILPDDLPADDDARD